MTEEPGLVQYQRLRLAKVFGVKSKKEQDKMLLKQYGYREERT